MKKLLLSLLLVSTTSMAENSITKAIKEDPWPVYKCTMLVNDNEVLTSTNKEEYKTYSMQPRNMHVYTYPISDAATFRLVVSDKQATGIIYHNNEIVSTYRGTCTK